MTANIAYTHKVDRRARAIKIKIEAPGIVTVVSPPFTPSFLVAGFVRLQRAWIESKLQSIQQVSTVARAETQDTIMIFGKRYHKRINFSAKQPIGVTIEGETVVINPVDQHADVSRQIQRFLKSTAAHYIPPRVAQLAQTMKTTYGTITLRQQKSRWGSCSSLGNLNFNWKLVHFAPAIIDYVIVHELAHRTHMNHSRQFWQLVARYDPEHRKHRGFLKRSGMMVG